MAVEDDDLSDLERRMRAKLRADEGTQSARTLSDEEQRIARRLLGTANAERIANAKEGRRVRVAPVVTIVEYWWVKSRDLLPDTWHIDVMMNRRKEESFSGTDPEKLNTRLAEYRSRNIGCRRIYLTGQERDEPSRPVGQRKSFADRYGWDIVERVDHY